MDIGLVILVLTLLSGVALFLYGMSVMGDGLKQVAGNRLEHFLYKLTNTPIKGLLLGAGVTAVIQSSSATTVMVVGFVNSGMMKLAQAIGIIMGANIGTSITGWVLCLSYLDGQQGIARLLSTATISAIVAILGIIFKMFAKKDASKSVGNIMLGFAILMIGMQTMSGAMAPLKESSAFIQMLTSFTNPFLGFLFGILLTAVLQSASASIGVLQALSVTGALTYSSVFPMIMGVGIGASCPVLLSAIGTNVNGKRTALCYLVNDCCSAILGSIFFTIVHFVAPASFLTLVMSPVYIAMVNTIYRGSAMIILLPFTRVIEKVVTTLIPGSDEEEDEEDFDLLEDRFLAYPPIAINQCHKSIVSMAQGCKKNLVRAFSLSENYDEKLFKRIIRREGKIDQYEDKLGRYLMQLTGKPMSQTQSHDVTEFLHSIGDFERMGDHAFDIAEVYTNLNEKEDHFSEYATKEIKVLSSATIELMDLTIQSFEQSDIELAKRVEPLRDLIGILCDELKMRHVERLSAGDCNFDVGFNFNEILNDCERIADHCSNVAVCLIEMSGDQFDTHNYLSNYRKEKSGDYARYFREYDLRYKI